MVAKIKGAAIGEDANSTSLTLKNLATADNSTFTLTLQTAEADIAANDIIGTLNFQAPAEGTGTDAILVAAGIEAVSEGDFSSSSNATKLSFKTASSEAAAEKMSLSSAGLLTVSNGVTLSDGDVVFADGHGIDFSAKADTGTGESATGSKLTDYEQGTFTANPTTDGTDYTTSSRGGACFYTKIGDWVSIQMNWFITTPSGTSSSGSLEITGLPFVCNASGNSVVGAASFGRAAMPSGVQVMAFVYDNESKIRFFATVSGASSGAFSADNLEGQITPFGQVFVSYPCD